MLLSIPASRDLSSETIDTGYDIFKLVRRTRAGSVYLARCSDSGAVVTVRHVRMESASEAAYNRFLREASILRSLRHPNLVRLLDYAVLASGEAFTVSKPLQGKTVSDMVSDGPLPEDLALQIAHGVCVGLQQAHRHGVYHRDLGGSSVQVSGSGVQRSVKVGDFGLGKRASVQTGLTLCGQFGGSVLESAPEQLNGGAIDGRTDVYAVGALLCLMLTGRRVAALCPLNVFFEWLGKHSKVSPITENVVRCCMELRPDHRWSSVGVLAQKLRVCLSHVQCGTQFASLDARSELTGRELDELPASVPANTVQVHRSAREASTRLEARAPLMLRASEAPRTKAQPTEPTAWATFAAWIDELLQSPSPSKALHRVPSKALDATERATQAIRSGIRATAESFASHADVFDCIRATVPG